MTRYALGWLPELPDIRDYTPEHPKLTAMARTALVGRSAALTAFPSRVDNRKWCSPIENQESIGSCTAHAAIGMYEYMLRRAHGRHLDLSRLFVYKTTRNLMGMRGDTGAWLRSTMGALKLFGAPPESAYPYQTADFDREPGAYQYAFAQSFQALTYFRLDTPGLAPAALLSRIKSYLFRGYAIMFGFTVYSSIWERRDGLIPYPEPGESVDGGHAVMACGYDDTQHGGALLIRNSWGDWGEGGYGWLPYTYVLTGQAEDFWAMTRQEFVDTGAFAP